MLSAGMPKVCFPVAGVPAVARSIHAYRACGIETVVVVVGSDAGRVVDAVGPQCPEVLFAYQMRPGGTGDAARTGLMPLLKAGFRGPVMVAAGDKVVDRAAVQQAIDAFRRAQADAVLVVRAKPPDTAMGRVVAAEDGRALAMFEKAELQQASLCRKVACLARSAASRGRGVDPARIRAACLAAFGDPDACRKRAARVWRMAQRTRPASARSVLALTDGDAGRIRVGDQYLTPRRAEAMARYVNESLYLFTIEALQRGLSALRRSDDREEYLTDVVNALIQGRARGREFRVHAVCLDQADLILGFNTPDELLNVELAVRKREGRAQKVTSRAPRVSARVLKPAGKWLELFEEPPPRLRRWLARVYGPDQDVQAERRRAYASALRLFVRRHRADTKAAVVHAPGTINLMGRHVDAGGGYINVMSIAREVIMVASPREDDLVRLANVDHRRFPSREFAIHAEIAALDWDDWLRYIRSSVVKRMLADSRGDWSNYVKAGVLRLQQRFRDVRICGMDAVVHGNIPPAAGLSASASTVVAASEASVVLNGLDVTPQQFVHLCGEGEWLLGTREGAGRHAAIKLGRRGALSHVRFFPLELDRQVEFPESHRLLLCRAAASGADLESGRGLRARRAAELDIAMLLVKDRFPQYAHLLDRVRDLNRGRLGIDLKTLYRLFLSVPPHAKPRDVPRLLSSGRAARLKEIMSDHAPPARYDLRGVLLYAVAECARSERLPELLDRRDFQAVGASMAASHNAERVVRTSERGGTSPYEWSASDAYLDQSIADLASEDPDRVARAQLDMQPGRYAFSTPEIDRLVDLAASVPGVDGAQLSGGGAGACAMVLARAEAVDALVAKLEKTTIGPGDSGPKCTCACPWPGPA